MLGKEGSTEGKSPLSLTLCLGKGKHKQEGSQSPSLPLSSACVKKLEDAQTSLSHDSVCQRECPDSSFPSGACAQWGERERCSVPFAAGSG